jgi:hypothetical protein
VRDGDVDHGDASSLALMDVERDEGKTLPCSARPRSDVTIEAEIDIDEDLEMYPVEDYVGTRVSLVHVARATVRLVVDLDREIAFIAGQYQGRVPGARRPQGDPAAGAGAGSQNEPQGRRDRCPPGRRRASHGFHLIARAMVADTAGQRSLGRRFGISGATVVLDPSSSTDPECTHVPHR